MVDLKKRFSALDALEFPHEEKPPTRAEPRPAQMIPRYSGVRAPVAIFALLVAAASLGFVVDAFRGRPEVREPVPPVGTGTIAYVKFDGATLKWSLFTVEADGSSDIRIAVDLPGEAFHPSWSPDGTKLAFDVQSGGDTEIYVATIYGSNGSNLSKLTTTPGWNFLPAWSPDGSRIAYVHTSGPNHDIWLMNADGSNPVRLTHDPDFDLNPTWSPDGTKVAFESNRTASPEVYVMNADGSHVSRLTNTPGFDGSPAWSPDGRQIAFVSDRDGPGIYVMKSDGSNVEKVFASAQVGSLEPEWSPDGARLAYSSSPGPDAGAAISVIDLLSGQTRVLTETAGELCCPSWRSRPSKRPVWRCRAPVDSDPGSSTAPRPLGLASCFEGRAIRTSTTRALCSRSRLKGPPGRSRSGRWIRSITEASNPSAKSSRTRHPGCRTDPWSRRVSGRRRMALEHPRPQRLGPGGQPCRRPS